MLTNFSTLENEHVKSLVKESLELQLNSQITRKEVFRFFNDLEDLARKIFGTPHLKSLRTSFYGYFQHFDEIINQYDLIGDEGNIFVEMLIARTKKIIGMDFKLKSLDLQKYLNVFQ